MISGTEWIVIGVVAIVLVLWGPKKIPELARSLGKAKGEFDVATQEFEKATKITGERADARTSDEILIETAKKLGIQTEGKTLEAISQEMLEKREARTSDDILMETAKKLGIETEGKTLDAISQEILEKTK